MVLLGLRARLQCTGKCVGCGPGTGAKAKTGVFKRSQTGFLESILRHYRTEKASEQGMPAMNVFGDRVLKGIVASRPTTLKKLQRIKGIGAGRQAKYGADILQMVGMSKQPGARPVVSRFFARPLSAQPLSALALEAPPCPKPNKPTAPAKPKPKPRPKGGEPQVYVLELEQGRVYVGSSRNVDRRVAQHRAGTGSAYTRVYKPTGVMLPRLGNVGGEGDAAERDETLRYMMLRGIPYVRGWKFAQVVMTPGEFDEAEANIRELFDLCRKCGYKGHFMGQCKATYDRWGQETGKTK